MIKPQSNCILVSIMYFFSADVYEINYLSNHYLVVYCFVVILEVRVTLSFPAEGRKSCDVRVGV